MQIFDSDGIEHDWNWLLGKYGRLEYRQATDYPRYELVRIQESIGPAVLKVKVLDETNTPAQVLAIMTYPDLRTPASNLPDLTQGDAAKSPWSTRGIAQFTDSITGLTGFGLGADSWIRDMAAGGPYHVWLFHTQYASDCLSWLGWLGGTDHQGPCDLTFKLKLSADNGTSYPGPDTSTLLILLERIAVANERLALDFEKLLAHIGAV